MDLMRRRSGWRVDEDFDNTILLIHQRDFGMEAAGLLLAHGGVGYDQDLITRLPQPRRSAVERDHTASLLSGKQIGCEPCAVVEVQHLYHLIGKHIHLVHYGGVERQTTDVMEVRSRKGGAMNLGAHHRPKHCLRSPLAANFGDRRLY